MLYSPSHHDWDLCPPHTLHMRVWKGDGNPIPFALKSCCRVDCTKSVTYQEMFRAGKTPRQEW